MKVSAVLCGLLALVAAVRAGDPGSRATYMGGTLSNLPSKTEGLILTTHGQQFIFHSRSATVRVPYERINLLEYGQNTSRRYAMAIVISPLLLLSKKKIHFLSVGYEDEEGRQQAMVLKVDKSRIRSVLVSLEARTGLKVQYQDEEARKSGKG